MDLIFTFYTVYIACLCGTR